MVRSKEERVRAGLKSVLSSISSSLEDHPKHVQILRNIPDKTHVSAFSDILQKEIEEICQSKDKSTTARSNPSSSASRTVDSFEDFDDMETEEVEDTDDLDLLGTDDPRKEKEEQSVACEILLLMSALSPVTGRDLAALKMLQEMLKRFQYSKQVTAVILPSLRFISPSFDDEVLDKVGDVLVDLAKNFVTAKKFISWGVVSLCRVLQFLVPSLGKHDTRTREICCKILEGLVK